ncbi:vWA domain-containing protein [Paracoccus beibuensis]|uniref:vWA domain-containing protein n=1 Tax=Paracoccus beibuensis TaxID=547602 RepID=UPI00223F05B9|nr:VWA domain-containing protein [Paracoccus beibuensis]
MILLRPWWLVALLPLAALAVWSARRAPEAGGWESVMPPQMLAAMQAMGALTGAGGRWVRILPVAAALALVLGLAGPALPRDDVPVLARTDSVMIAIDLSPSVAKGAALGQAQQAVAALLQGVGGRPVGLILYGGEAFAASAPTTDPRTLETLIAVMDHQTMPATGSRPAAAIGMAGQMLTDTRQADVVLVTDGGGVDRQAMAEAGRLADMGVRLWALRLTGLAAEATVPDPDALKALTQGGDVLAADNADSLAARLRTGGDAVRDPMLRALGYLDLGPFLAALAVLPLLFMLRRRT